MRVLYSHWGTHSGFNQLLQHLDGERFSVDEHRVPDNDDDFPFRHPLVRRLVKHQVQKHGMEWYKLSDLTEELRAFRDCRRGSVDVIHFFDGEHSVQYLPRLLRRFGPRRVGLVASFHQPPDLLASLVRPEVIKMLDHVTVVAPNQVPFFDDLLPSDRVALIPHGVDTDFFRPALPPARSPFRCVTVGHWLRDFRLLRVVAQNLASGDVFFDVVSGDVEGLDDLPNVVLHRRLDDQELLELYRRANLLFLPLSGSTANNSLLEGIACGLPVVSTDLPAIRSYVSERAAILVQDNCPDEFVAAIRGLRDDPARCAAMSKAARNHAEQLSWKRLVARYEALYSRLYSRPVQARARTA